MNHKLNFNEINNYLLIPFCLAKSQKEEIKKKAAEKGFKAFYPASTSEALNLVKQIFRTKSVKTKIVGIICIGRAKKVGLWLFAFKIKEVILNFFRRQKKKNFLAFNPVLITSGNPYLWGKKNCKVGENLINIDELSKMLDKEEFFIVF